MYTIRRQEIERENYSNFLATEEDSIVYLSSRCTRLKVDVTRKQNLVEVVARYFSGGGSTVLARLLVKQLPQDPQDLIDQVYKKLLGIGAGTNLRYVEGGSRVVFYGRLQNSYAIQEGHHKYRRFLDSKAEQVLIILRDFHTGGVGVRRRDDGSFDVFLINKYSEMSSTSVRVRSLPETLTQLTALFSAAITANKAYQKALYDLVGGM